MFLVVNEPEEQEFFFEKIKISANSGIWLALVWNFLQFSDILAGPQSKLTEKQKTQL
jgi:hypothetical protein